MHRNNSVYFLIAILLLMAVLNLYKIEDQGTFDEDALVYYTAARTDIAVAKWIISGKNYSLHDYLEEKQIYPRANIYGKPFYHFLSMISLLVFGDHDYSLQIINALFSVATILIIFKIGEYLYGTKAGLYAALFCLLSPIFLWLSRTNMAHMPQLLFFFTGMYFYLKSRDTDSDIANTDKLILSGVFMALSILTHPSAIVFTGLFFLFELYLFVFVKRQYLLFAKRAIILVLPAVIFSIATNIILDNFKISMGAEGIKEYVGGIYMNYFEQFGYNSKALVAYKDVGGDFEPSTVLSTARLKTKILDTLKSYFYDLWVFEGSLRIIVMLTAFVYLVRDYRTKNNLLLVILIAIPYLFFISLIANPTIRNILTIFPLFAIASGRLIDRAISASSNKLIPSCLFILLFVQLSLNIIPIYSIYTGFRNVADWLKEKKIRSVLTPDIHMQVDPYMDIYGVRTVVLKDPEDIKKYRDIKYTVIAMRESFFNPLKEDKHLQFAKTVIKNNNPLIKEKHIPSLTAMDMYRRENSFIVNWMIKTFLGRDFRRSPIDIYVYQTKELMRDDNDIATIKSKD